MFFSLLLQQTAPYLPAPDWILHLLKQIHDYLPLFGLLIALMGVDIVMGIFAAFVTKTLSSAASSKGMAKKVMILLLVTVCRIIEQFAGDVPLSKLASMCFIVFELTSIIENCARAGVPIPPVVTDALAALKSAARQKPSVPLSQPAIQINRATNVEVHAESAESKSTADSVVIRSSDVPAAK